MEGNQKTSTFEQRIFNVGRSLGLFVCTFLPLKTFKRTSVTETSPWQPASWVLLILSESNQKLLHKLGSLLIVLGRSSTRGYAPRQLVTLSLVGSSIRQGSGARTGQPRCLHTIWCPYGRVVVFSLYHWRSLLHGLQKHWSLGDVATE